MTLPAVQPKKWVTPANPNGKHVPPRFVGCPVCGEHEFTHVDRAAQWTLACDTCGHLLSFAAPLRELSQPRRTNARDLFIAYFAVALVVPIGWLAKQAFDKNDQTGLLIYGLPACLLLALALISYFVMRDAGRTRLQAAAVLALSAVVGLLMVVTFPPGAHIVALVALAAFVIGFVSGNGDTPYGEPKLGDVKEPIEVLGLGAAVFALAGGTLVPETLKTAGGKLQELLIACAVILVFGSRFAARLGSWVRAKGVKLV